MITKPIEDGGYAFPRQNDETGYGEFGMTLRDYFAGQAIAGQVAYEGMEGCDAHHLTNCAYEMADYMLAARARKRGK
jgi:hypothetical protein